MDGEGEGEQHGSVAFLKPPIGDLARNAGMCPDQESNQQPFGLQSNTKPTEPPQPGMKNYFKNASLKSGTVLGTSEPTPNSPKETTA